MAAGVPIPNELPAVLVDAGARGVELATDTAGRLRHRPATLPPDLAARLRLYRADVLGILAGEGIPHIDDGEAGYIIGERLGMADELGMQTHPGAPAWLVATGEALIIVAKWQRTH
ncbi:MAG: hypothetical protein GY715_06525 [Planctomycetes bacterium]|nr:hypothetical protein [Planctomycetota bacterium]